MAGVDQLSVAGEEPLLVDALGAFASDLKRALTAAGRPELAAQVAELRITRPCACDSHACASFYTTTRPIVRWFRRGCQIELGGLEGAITLDVVAGEIVYVEVLFRDDVRAALNAAFPPPPAGS